MKCYCLQQSFVGKFLTFNQKIEKEIVGLKFKTNNFGEVKVIKYEGTFKVLVAFEDGTELYVHHEHLKRGSIRNPNSPSVYGVGFTGIGVYSKSNNYNLYKTWQSMLQRCYDSKYKNLQKTYKDCIVEKEWHNFQNFAEWAINNPYYCVDYHLDKDIINPGNKIYSKFNCAFVPREINSLFSTNIDKKTLDLPIGVTKHGDNKFRAQWSEFGVMRWSKGVNSIEEAFSIYKINRERYLKELAETWKGKIDPRVYESLINYKIKEIYK